MIPLEVFEAAAAPRTPEAVEVPLRGGGGFRLSDHRGRPVLVGVLLALRGRESARTLVVLAGAVAVLASLFLYGVSKVELGFVCAWCLRLYAVNAAIFALPLLGGRPVPPDLRAIGLGAVILGVWLVGSIGAERRFRASLLGGDAPVLVEAVESADGRDPEGVLAPRTVTVTTEAGREVPLALGPQDAWKGNPQAKVVVVEFADLECPYCKRMASELSRLEASYGDRVLFVFKHFPMDPACNPGVKNKLHREACVAARAAVCAREQGRFWRFHDLAFKNQHDLSAPALRDYARAAGVEPGAFEACLADPRSAEAIRQDGEVGQGLDIGGTPRIFVDGALHRAGSSAEVMARALERALGAGDADAAKRAAALRQGRPVAPPVPADTPAMRQVERDGTSFRIDTFEGAIREGRAVSGRREIPALRLTWFEARAACEAAGKRLCSEEEWVTACQGARAIDDDGDGQLADARIEGTAYPYGDLHEPGRCWDGREGLEFRPVYTGEMPGCVSADGVYDLTGNVEEWAGLGPDEAVLLGGAWDTSKDHARCYRRNDRFGPGYAAIRSGFRCCAP